MHTPKASLLPKTKAGRCWLAAAAAVTAIGTIFINALGKKKNAAQQNEEKSKTDAERAGDVAYTVNHALSCGTTDVVLQPVIAAAFGVNVGCNHPGHNHGPQKLTLKRFAQEAGHYFKGEIIGDFAAVPLTISVQRLFPNFMTGLRQLLEPAFGWTFRMGANHAARSWAAKAGISAEDPQTKIRADTIYEHEISHLPQAVVWNLFAYPIGAVAQKSLGHGQGYAQIFKSKLVGACVSNGLLLGGRMLAPQAAQKWDAYTGDRLFLPVSNAMGKLFGIDAKVLEAAVKKERAGVDGSWEARLRADSSADIARG